MKPSDVEVSEHLGNMGIGESDHNLGVNDDSFINEQIGNQCADFDAIVIHSVRTLIV